MKKDERLFVPIDVRLPSNRKLAGVDPRAKWLYVVGLCWAKQDMNDGVFYADVAIVIAGVEKRWRKVLVDCDVWHEKGHACPRCPQPDHVGQIVVHDYLEHNKTAAEVKDGIAAKRAAARLGNHLRYNHEGDVGECHICNK